MTTWLFTWNPARWEWESLPRDARAVRSGRACSEDYWTTGTTTSVREGDRFFLLKQGPKPRGIIGSGRVISDSRSEEHTSELQLRQYIVCRLLLEKKKFFQLF